MRVSSFQSARSQIPGSRSSQRPCVSAMSSGPGVKTSKMKRPCPVARRLDTARRARRRSSSVSMWSSERNGQSTSGNCPSTGGSRMSPWRRSTLTPASSARSRATSSIPAEMSTPTTSMPAAATGTAIRPVPTPSSSTGPPVRSGLGDVERHVLGDAHRPRVVHARDGVVGGHWLPFYHDARDAYAKFYSAPVRTGARCVAPSSRTGA